MSLRNTGVPGVDRGFPALKNPASVLSFCRQRFTEIKDLVDNTDSSGINVDFPHYVHRLRHLVTRLRHLLQFVKLGSDIRPSVPEFQDEFHRLIAKIVDELGTAGYIHPDQDQIIGIPLPPITEGSPVYNSVNDLAHAKLIAAPSSLLSAQVPSGSQVQAIPIRDCLTQLGAPCIFDKLPHPIQKMFENFPVTDGLQVDSLIIFLRVLGRIWYIAPAFNISTPQVLQILYGHTKGPLASKTMAAIHRGYTLEAYHRDVVASFIPPHTMLPLLNSLYYRPQGSEEHLSD
jgi:hypothetical protein